MDQLYLSNDSFLLYTLEAEKLSNHLNDPYYVAKIHMYKGIYYEVSTEYDSSLYHYHQASEIAEQRDSLPALLVDIYYYVSLLYESLEDTAKSMKYGEKSLKLALKDRSWSRAAYIAMGIADVYWGKKQYKQALYHYYQSKSYASNEKMPINFWASSYTNMGTIFIDWGRHLDSALYYFRKCYTLKDSLPDNEVYMHMHTEANMFKYYFTIGQYDTARYYLDRAYTYSIQLASPYYTSYFYKYYSELFAATGKMDSAYSLIKKHYHLEDSISGIEIKRNTEEIEAKYQSAKKEKQILQYRKQKEIDEARKQTLLIAVFLSTALLLLTFIFFLNNRKKSRKLAEQNVIIQKSYNEIENLIRESHHRIKNNLQVVSSLLKMQSKNVQSEEARTSLLEAFNRVKTIAVLHQKLQGSQTFKVIQLREFIDQLTDNIRHSLNDENRKVDIRTDVDEMVIDTDQSISLGLIINELITNSIKYAFDDGHKGEITVQLQRVQEDVRLKVTDNGKGFPQNFNPANGTSLGYKIIKSLVTKLNGQMQFKNEQGARVEISFPSPQKAA